MADRKLRYFSRQRTYRLLFGILGLLVVSMMLARPLLAQAAGSSIWSIVNSPNPATASSSNDSLAGVTALSDTNVWAAGTFSTNNINSTLIEHWDGSAWTVVPSPNGSTQGSVMKQTSFSSL